MVLLQRRLVQWRGNGNVREVASLMGGGGGGGNGHVTEVVTLKEIEW